MSSLLYDYYKQGLIREAECKCLCDALHKIGIHLEHNKKKWIPIHSDLSLSNILITEQGLAFIDFSLFGISSPLLDFGSIYAFIDSDECREKILYAYHQTTGIKVKEQDIKYYLAFQILLSIFLHFDLWYKEEWFQKRLPQWCEKELCL